MVEDVASARPVHLVVGEVVAELAELVEDEVASGSTARALQAS